MMNDNEMKNRSSSGGLSDALQPGTPLLQGQYVIDKFLNSGGFGMTYLARDSLDRTVVIKECFPASFCNRTENVVRAHSRSQQNSFKSIVRLFVQEARQLSKLEHPNIVGVHQVFEDNETAYMALDFIDGQDMMDAVETGKLNVGQDMARRILLKVLEAVAYVHEQGILHRDISPDNILLERNGNPILIDFGAAREKATKKSRALSALMVVKDGYSPQEFYVAGAEQAPASDLYSLAASFYHFLTGNAPPNSQTRLAAVAAKEDDPYVSLVEQMDGYDKDFLQAIDKSLSIFPTERHRSARDWILEIDVEQRIATALDTAKRDRNMDREISKLVMETNLAVLEAEKQAKIKEKEAKIKAKEMAEAAEIQKALILLEPDPDDLEYLDDAEDDEDLLVEQVACEEGATEQVEGTVKPRGLFRRSIWRFWVSDKTNDEHYERAG